MRLEERLEELAADCATLRRLHLLLSLSGPPRRAVVVLGRNIWRMAKSMPGRKVGRPAQGKNEYSGTKARRVTIVKPLVHSSVHARPSKRLY